MFTDFDYPKGDIFIQPVNTVIGCAFLGSCALWAALLVFNMTTGSNPIDRSFNALINNQAQYVR